MPDDKKAQDQINQAVKPETPKVEEHSISEAEAKKFAGQGDFSLPLSPLDELMVTKEGEAAKEQTQKAAAQPVPSTSKPVPSSPQPIISTTQPLPAKPMVQPTKPDTAQPVPAVDLEKKAKDMLKDLGKTQPAGNDAKPKKKKGSAVTKMALAAVLVVLMGAGGVVGVNLLKMQQVGDIRQQAYTRIRNEGTIECWESDVVRSENPPADIKLKVELKQETPNSGSVGDSCTPRSDGASYTNVYTITNNDDKSHTVVFKKDSNYCVNDPCGVDESGFKVCHEAGQPSENVPLDLAPGESKDITVTRASDVGQSCGSYQVDITLVSVSGAFECRDFVASGVLLTGNTCPSGGNRPDMCEDVVPGDPDVSTLQSGQSMQVTAKSNLPASRFQLSFYNPENQDSGGPKPLMIGGSHYVMLSPVVDLTTEHTFTVNYADIHKPDENWGNQIPSSVVYYAYFFDANGNFSSNVAECHGTINFGSAPTPTPTPTPPPGQLTCTSLTGGGSTHQIGDVVTLTCTGGGATINHYEFRYQVNGGAWQPLTATSNRATLTVNSSGSYSAQCRVCGTTASSSCTAWDVINPDDN